jgi:hypothetical protein
MKAIARPAAVEEKVTMLAMTIVTNMFRCRFLNKTERIRIYVRQNLLRIAVKVSAQPRCDNSLFMHFLTIHRECVHPQ